MVRFLGGTGIVSVDDVWRFTEWPDDTATELPSCPTGSERECSLTFIES